jgi:hypothetical protein
MPPPPPHAFKFSICFHPITLLWVDFLSFLIMGGPPIIHYYDVNFSSHGPLTSFPSLYYSCHLDLLNLDHTTNVVMSLSGSSHTPKGNLLVPCKVRINKQNYDATINF